MFILVSDMYVISYTYTCVHTHVCAHTQTRVCLSFLVIQLELSACREAADRDPGSQGEEAPTSDGF